MSDEVKVTDAPKASGDETLIDNPRAAVEKAVIAENETPDVREDVEDVPPAKVEEKVEEAPQLSEVDRIKQAVQKRIDKVVAKQKSAEEQLAEAQAEIARLRANPNTAETPTPKDNAEPTLEQVEAYILKMREEGNAKEEIAATRYLIKLEKDLAIKAVRDEEAKARQEVETRAQRENQALLELARDYVVLDEKGQADMKHDLTLANQKGKLFEVAMGLYNDPDLHKLYYNDPDRANGLRRAVSDAYREIHQQGLLKTPKVDGIEAKRVNRQVLADPDATEAEDIPTPQSNLLSDAEKVREEIKARNRMRNSRRPQ